MGVETGKTEVTASEVAGVLEAEVVAEVTMMVGIEEMTSGIVTDETSMMIPRVSVVVAEATVVIEVDMVLKEVDMVLKEVDMVLKGVDMVLKEVDMVLKEADMAVIVTTHVRLILLAAATTNRQARQLLTHHLPWHPLVPRPRIAWNKPEECNSYWLP
jgi:hypothetical protein